MNNKTVIAAIVVVVVVVVVAAAAYSLNSGGNDGPATLEASGDQGMVFGNANGDCRIDTDDVQLIEQIIESNDPTNVSKYPFADVNHDGIVDATDLQMVNDIIDGKATTVDVSDFTGNHVTVPYPMDNLLVVGGTNMRVVVSVLNMEDRILATATNKYMGPYLDKTLYDLCNAGTIKTVTTGATAEDMTAISSIGLKVAIIEGAGTNSWTEDYAMQYLRDNGITPLVFNTDNYNYVMSTISTIGILIGAENEAQSYLDFLNDVNGTIQERLGDSAGTATVMTVTMSNSVSGTESDYYAMSELAGGKNLADWADSTRKYNPNSGDYWLLDPKYNPDFLFHFKSMVYGENPTQSTLDSCRSYFEETNAYKDGNYYLINGTAPLPVRLAYMAEIMYPDLFEDGWADSVFQRFIDDFTDLENWDVTEHRIIWSVSDF